MSIFYPNTGTVAEWNAAYYRLEDYLRAHHLVNKLYQSQIVLHLLERAAMRHAFDPTQSPTTLALEEATITMERWFGQVFAGESPARAAVRGRVAMYLVDAAEKWPLTIFAEQAVPVELQNALQAVEVQAGPDWQITRMVPRPLDTIPLLDFLDENVRWPVPTALLVGAAVVVSFGFFFYLFH